MLRVLKNIVRPKRKLFYNYINEVNSNLKNVNNLFLSLVQETEYLNRVKLIKEIVDIEKQNELLVHKVFVELGLNYVTPYDREDIYGLVKTLSSISQNLVKVSTKINFYKINPQKAGLDHFAIQVGSLVNDVVISVNQLKKMKFSKEYIKLIKEIFNKHNQNGDSFLITINLMFDEYEDPKMVIKTREILKNLEAVSYRAKECGNLLESMIVKYA
jgi:uncharacterized protein Yka (UPF0111/DUF47 family)